MTSAHKAGSEGFTLIEGGLSGEGELVAGNSTGVNLNDGAVSEQVKGLPSANKKASGLRRRTPLEPKLPKIVLRKPIGGARYALTAEDLGANAIDQVDIVVIEADAKAIIRRDSLRVIKLVVVDRRARMIEIVKLYFPDVQPWWDSEKPIERIEGQLNTSIQVLDDGEFRSDVEKVFPDDEFNWETRAVYDSIREKFKNRPAEIKLDDLLNAQVEGISDAES